MTIPTDDEDSEANRKKKGDSGEGDADSFGRGKAGAASGVARLSPQKLKEVMANWRELKAQDLVDAVVEFFSEGPMRASANAAVSWAKKTNAKSFAIVNWAIEAGDKAVREFTRARDRAAGRDSKGFRREHKGPKGKGFANPNPNTTGPAG